MKTYRGYKANIGTCKDHEMDGQPVCDCCLSQTAEWVDYAERWIDDNGKVFTKIHNPTEACHSCCTMIDEAIHTVEEDAKIDRGRKVVFII